MTTGDGLQQVLLGKTGIQVSRLCFGTLTLGPLQRNMTPEAGGAVVSHAIRRGITFFDTAQLYGTYAHLRAGMEQSGRFDIVIATKTYAYQRAAAVEAVEQARRELNRDTIDIFLLHEQESKWTLAGHAAALEYLLDCREKGIIKAVGASMHHVAAVYGGIAHKLDVIHPLINQKGLGIVDGSREDMEKALEAAHAQGIGIFGMKALGGGNLWGDGENCLRYAFGLSFLDAVAVGMSEKEEVDANITLVEKGAFTPAQRSFLAARRRELHIDDWCQNCGACVKRCGQSALRQDTPSSMPVWDRDRCVLCGYCATVCPAWAIKII